MLCHQIHHYQWEENTKYSLNTILLRDSHESNLPTCAACGMDSKNGPVGLVEDMKVK